MPTDEQRAADLARAFHEAYERLAPSFGYETRRESAAPWESVPDQNRALMTAVCAEVMAPLLASREAAARAGAVDECKAIVERAAIQAGYGFFHSDNPHEFRPDPECTTEQERENHRLACEAYDRGEPIPAQNFTPDASTFVNGVLVHQTGGPWGIGTYTFKDDAFSGALDEIRTLAATPPDRVVVAVSDAEMAATALDLTAARWAHDEADPMPGAAQMAEAAAARIRAALARLGEP